MKYLFLLLFSFPVWADNNQTVNNYTYNLNDSIAVSLASGAHKFDWSTNKLQGSVGMGIYDNNEALSFGVAKRIDKILVNGSVTQGDKTAISAGIGWRF